jgi:hypothetical protein
MHMLLQATRHAELEAIDRILADHGGDVAAADFTRWARAQSTQRPCLGAQSLILPHAACIHGCALTAVLMHHGLLARTAYVRQRAALHSAADTTTASLRFPTYLWWCSV